MPLTDAVLRSLKSQYVVPAGNLTPYMGLVVLGGDIEVPRGVHDSRAFVLSNGGSA